MGILDNFISSDNLRKIVREEALELLEEGKITHDDFKVVMKILKLMRKKK